MHKVVQHAEIEVHPDFVQNRLQPGVERLTILPHHQGGPDGTKTLRRFRHHPRNNVMRLRTHLSLLPALEPTATRSDGYRFEPGGDAGQIRAILRIWTSVDGAGDGNRTRTVSLGSRTITPGHGLDLVNSVLRSG